MLSVYVCLATNYSDKVDASLLHIKGQLLSFMSVAACEQLSLLDSNYHITTEVF